MSTDRTYLEDLPLAGQVISMSFEDWPPGLRAEFEHNAFNGQVGGKLLSISNRLRIWEISLLPGERIPAHRHVLDYMWTAISAGESRQHTHDGTTRKVRYEVGETRNYVFGPGEYLMHDLENIGDTTLRFITVELLQGANQPLEPQQR